MLPTIPSGGNEFEVAQATEQGPVLKTKTKKEKGLKYLFNGVSPQASPGQPAFCVGKTAGL